MKKQLFSVYCIIKMNMDSTSVTKTINTKMHTMIRALKLGRVK